MGDKSVQQTSKIELRMLPKSSKKRTRSDAEPIEENEDDDGIKPLLNLNFRFD
jgi:hypothetical protein